MLGRNTEHTRTLRKTLVCTLLLSILLITFLNIKPVYAQAIVLTPSCLALNVACEAGSTIAVSGLGFSSIDTSCTISGPPVTNTRLVSPVCNISGGTVTGSFVVSNAQANVYCPYS